MMNLDSEALVNPLLIRLGYSLLHLLWQATLVAAISALGLRLLRPASANHRYLFLTAMFGIMAVLPMITFFLACNPNSMEAWVFANSQTATKHPYWQAEERLREPTTSASNSGVATVERTNAAIDAAESSQAKTLYLSTKPERVIRLLVFSWAVGVCLLSLRLFFGWLSMIRLRRTGISRVQSNIKAVCNSLCRRLRVQLRVEVFESTIVQVPAVVGWMRPIILVPTRLITGLSDEELRAVLAHEIAHIRRYDYLVNLGQIVVENFFFYHPAIWWISSLIRQEREHCCDDIAVQACGSGPALARVLATLAELNAGLPMMLPGANGGSVVHRIRRLLKSDAQPKRTNSAAVGLCALTPLVLVTFLAVFTPTLIQAAPQEDAREAFMRMQRLKAQEEAQRIHEIFDRKQIAADKREAEEQAEQLELSKNWSLKFPEDVQGNEFAGLIVNEMGQPLVGAKIDLFPAFTGHETTTDDQGMFRYKLEYANRTYTEVRFSKDGYSPVYRRKQRLDIPNLCIVLNSRTYLEGQIIDENNKPVSKVKVIAAHPFGWLGEYHSFNRETETVSDDNGHYRLYLNPEEYTVAAISERLGVERVRDIEVKKNEFQTIDLRLKAGVHFRASVLDAETKEPVEGLTLYHRTNALARGVSNANGMIEILHALPGDEELQVGSGPPVLVRGYYSCPTEPFGSWWSPDARKPWHRKSTTETAIMFELTEGMKPVTIYVQAGVLISGKVTDPEGNPVAGATVAPARTGTGNSLTGDNRYSVETKEDGSYVVCLPPSGEREYNLLAHDGTYLNWRKFASGVTEPFRTKAGQRIENVDIQLHQAATVRGRVKASDGRILKGLQVRAHAADRHGNRYYDPTTGTKEDGTFEMSFIRPGKHFIEVEPFFMNAEVAPAESSKIIDFSEGETIEGILLEVAGEK